MITLVVKVVSFLVIVIGFFGLISPAGITAWVARWRSRGGLWTAVVF